MERKYTLMVSFNCGTSYRPFMKSDSIEELIKRTEQKGPKLWDDISWTRWYIEDNEGEAVKNIVCPIHKGIIEFLEKINQEDKK